MIFHAPLRWIRSARDPYKEYIWPSPVEDGLLRRRDVAAAVQEGRLRAAPWSTWTEADASQIRVHAERVACLVVHPATDPIEIDVGCPELGYDLGTVPDVLDGFHRIAAAIYRGDKTIRVDGAGSVAILEERAAMGGRLRRKAMGHLGKIELNDFWPIDKLTLDLGRVNVFIGEHATGKSGILRAIYRDHGHAVPMPQITWGFLQTLLGTSAPRGTWLLDHFADGWTPTRGREAAQRLCAPDQEKKQVVLVTYNPGVLDGIDLNDDDQRLFVVMRNDRGHTTVERIREAPDAQPRLKLSELWMRGLWVSVEPSLETR